MGNCYHQQFQFSVENIDNFNDFDETIDISNDFEETIENFNGFGETIAIILETTYTIGCFFVTLTIEINGFWVV